MSFFDRLRPASFRGIAFFVDLAAKEFGPRTVSHGMTLRTEPVHEFLGTLPESFTIEALLYGDDLDVQSRAFDAALTEQATGRLVHPLYGEIDAVVIGPVRSALSTREGRILRYSIPFQRAGGEASPTSRVDTEARVNSAAAVTRTAVIDEFAAAFAVAGQHALVLESARASLSILSAAIIGRFRGWAATSLVARAAESAARLANPSDALLAVPSALADELYGFVSAATAAPHSSALLLSLARPAGLALPAAPATTPARAVAARNDGALFQLVRAAAAIEAVAAGTASGWRSREEAEAWRDDVSAVLARLSESAADETSWKRMSDLRAAVTRDVAVRALPLPRLRSMTPSQTESSLLVAYRLDGDELTSLFDRASEIVTRNRVRHPGFVPGGRPLEVLVDE
jgi:prophage DNA circulation protein